MLWFPRNNVSQCLRGAKDELNEIVKNVSVIEKNLNGAKADVNTRLTHVNTMMDGTLRIAEEKLVWAEESLVLLTDKRWQFLRDIFHRVVEEGRGDLMHEAVALFRSRLKEFVSVAHKFYCEFMIVKFN